MGFLAVSLDPDRPTVEAAVKRLGIQSLVALAQDEVLGPMGVAAIPSTIFVSPDGKIMARANGARRADYFRKQAEQLLRP